MYVTEPEDRSREADVVSLVTDDLRRAAPMGDAHAAAEEDLGVGEASPPLE